MAGESKLQKKIIARLKSDGWDVNKRISMSHNGWADLECLKHGGVFMEIEVKDKGKNPTELQLYWIEKHTKMGFKSFWCDSFEMFLEKYLSI
jgi:hypothetical protein